jgi:hypothetical protein
MTNTHEVIHFVHAIDASIAVNLAYSILLRFANFSNSALDEWIRTHFNGITLALAENPTFNPVEFEAVMREMQQSGRQWTGGNSKFSIALAVIAIISGMTVLCWVGFNPGLAADHWITCTAVFILLCPIPAGLLGLGAINIGFRLYGKYRTREWSRFAKFFVNAPKQRIEDAVNNLNLFQTGQVSSSQVQATEESETGSSGSTSQNQEEEPTH